MKLQTTISVSVIGTIGLALFLFSVPKTRTLKLKAATLQTQELSEKLKAKEPALPKDARSNASTVGAMSLLLKPDDLSPIAGSKGLSSCATSSNHNAHTSKNFSNFGADCFRATSNSYYLNSDITLRKDNNTKLRPNFAWNGTQANEIFDPIPQRAIMRSAQTLVSENKALSDLLSGRLQLQISPDSIVESWSQEKPVENRPVYVVLETAENSRSAKPQVVASLGARGLLKAHRTRKKLVEEFQVLPKTSQTKSENGASGESSSVSENSKAVAARGFRDSLARQFGLASRPFSRFDLRLQRITDPKAAKEDLGLRLSESNGLVYAEKPSLSAPSDWAWGLRLPYGRHFVSLHYPDSKSLPLRSYGYVVDGSNQLVLAYNPNDLSYLLSLRTTL